MIGSNAFNYINVLNKAADASYLRNQLISNNIANNDTPNYKRKELKFEEYLEKELMKDRYNGGDLDKRVANLNLSNLKASVYTDVEELSYRLDGNNVNIETENAHLAENQIRYYALLDSMTQEFTRIESVLKKS